MFRKICGLSFVMSTALISVLVKAGPAREVNFLNVVSEVGGKTIVTDVPLKPVVGVAKLKIIHLDPSENPKKEVAEWSGFWLRDVLKKAAIKAEDKKVVTVAAVDDYSAPIPYKDIAAFDILLATHKNGNEIGWSNGGVHTIYPTTDAKLPKIYTVNSHYWAWSIAAIFVGSLQPTLDVLLPGNIKKTIKLGKDIVGENIKTVPHYPPAAREVEGPTKEAAGSAISLAKFIEKVNGSKPAAKVSALTYTQGILEVAKDRFADYSIIYAYGGKNIPIDFGGPVQICPSDKNVKCTYFIRSISVE